MPTNDASQRYGSSGAVSTHGPSTATTLPELSPVACQARVRELEILLRDAQLDRDEAQIGAEADNAEAIRARSERDYYVRIARAYQEETSDLREKLWQIARDLRTLSLIMDNEAGDLETSETSISYQRGHDNGSAEARRSISTKIMKIAVSAESPCKSKQGGW